MNLVYNYEKIKKVINWIAKNKNVHMKKYILFVFFWVSTFIALGQNIILKGTVVDENQTPIPGVSVFIEGITTIGTITNNNGEFKLEVKKDTTQKLVFSFIGYLTEKIPIGNQTTVKVMLIPDILNLDEVVVVGYGTQRKGDISVAISTVNLKGIESASVISLDQTLQGQAAGVVVSQSTGKPGAPVSIRIRGTTSINGINEPLYVIDGIPIITNPDDMTTTTIQASEINPLSSINPNDIESINILKDASATAIYGARGANGVILITTKRGTKGDLQVSLNTSVGIQQLSKKLDLLNARQLAELGNDAVTEARKYYPSMSYYDCYTLPSRFGTGTDWQDEIFRTAMMQNYQLSVRGGNDKNVYLISANYVEQEGIIKNSDFNKGTLRVNLDNELSDRIKLGVNLNFTQSINHGVITGLPTVSSSVVAMALLSNPGQSPYDENVEGGYTYQSNTPTKIPNPVAEINETERVTYASRGMGDVYLDWNIFKDLQYKFKVGIDAFYNKEQQYIPSYIYRGQEKGKGYNVSILGYTWLTENTLTYSKDFDIHHVTLLGGYTAQRFVSESTDIAVESFEDETLGYYDLSQALDKTILNSFNSWSMLSGLSRLNYNYNNKYYITASGRLDGSSKFGTQHKYGFFPSVSVAWRLSKEKFLEQIGIINDLKLRLSAGTVGNEGIPTGSTLSLMGSLPYYWGEGADSKAIGSYVYSLRNEDLKWEVTRQYDAGIDLNMFQSRIIFTAETYLKHTSDLLLYVPVNRSSGYSAVWENVGDMENRGLEFSLNTINLDKAFKWTSMFNISFNRNKVTNLAKSEEIYGTTIQGISDWTVIKENEAIGNIYGYKSDGIIQLNENPDEIPYFESKTARYGDRKYVDKNGDGKLTSDDYYKLGNTYPEFSYGLRNTFSYKRISLNIYIQGDYGNKIVNFNKFDLESFDGFHNNSTAALERWTEDNPTNKYPRANASPVGNIMSDIIVEDGSYLRVKEITLSYELPEKLLSQIKISNIKLSVSGINIYTLTNYSGYDPEVSIYGGSVYSKGVDYGAYPMAKTILFSANITF